MKPGILFVVPLLLALAPAGASITGGQVEVDLGGVAYSSGSTFSYSPYSTYSVGVVAYAKSDNPSCDVAWMRIIYSINGVQQSPDLLAQKVNICPGGWQIIGQVYAQNLQPGVNGYTLTLNGNFWGYTNYILQPAPTPTPYYPTPMPTPTPAPTPYYPAPSTQTAQTATVTTTTTFRCSASGGRIFSPGMLFTEGFMVFRCPATSGTPLEVVLNCDPVLPYSPDGGFSYVCPAKQTIASSISGGAAPRQPGFEAVFAVAGLLVVSYLVSRRGRRDG